MNRIFPIFGNVLLIAMFITGCATTTVTSAWRDQSYQNFPRKIMVIGIAKKPVTRRIIEDEMVRQLNQRGTDAIASYTVLPDDKKNDKTTIAAKVKEQHADAVLISRLASRKTIYTYVPGSAYYPPLYYGTWPEYYGYGYQAMYSPGYMAEDEYALMETNLYDASSNKLIWSVSSETEIRGSDENLIKSYVEEISKKMADQKLIR